MGKLYRPLLREEHDEHRCATGQYTNQLPGRVALVLGSVFPLQAIQVGHVARRQIVRTGERGDGLALIGLIFGYLGLPVYRLSALPHSTTRRSESDDNR